MMSSVISPGLLLCRYRALLCLPLSFLASLSACGDTTESGQGGGVADVSVHADVDAMPDSLVSDTIDLDDSDLFPTASTCSGDQLFGRPNATTGLSEEQCTPFCADCDLQGFAAREFSVAEIEQLRAWQLVEPFDEITTDPYLAEAPEVMSESVCGFLTDPQQPLTYRLETFASAEAAVSAGAEVTHGGICGVCSTLENLAVYIQNEDLTAPVRQCGLDGISDGKEANIACLQALGFDLPCAQIWYFNTENTRNSCFEPCIAALNEPYHLPDGSLNACLQCDEDNSGPVFKAVAGRTRRNSGLANALCRPCSEVIPLPHTYANLASIP
jgi:hypothetical protein